MTALTPAPSNIQTAPPSLPDLLGASPADLVDRWAEAAPATADEARQRADRIRSGLPVYAQMRQEIADAYAHRDWEALGHASWPEYLAIEFGTELARLATADRRAVVGDLRAQGMSMRQIANATGVGQSTVRDDIKVSGIHSPDRIAGSDGKSHPGTKPSADRVGPADASPEVPANTPGPAETSSAGATGAGPTPAPVADTTSPDGRLSRADRPVVADSRSATDAAAGHDPRPAAAPAKWSAEEREAHEEEVQIRKDIESAHTFAKNFVTEVRNQCFTILVGYRLGETHLVTAEQIADCRRALDLLEKEVIADAQR